MTWSIALCVYKSPAYTDVGHAFVAVKYNGRVCCAGGLWPGPHHLFENKIGMASVIFPGPGRVYAERYSLDHPHLRQKEWEVSWTAATMVMNKINADRRSNLCAEVPNGDSTPAEELTKHLEQTGDVQSGVVRTGGPPYALLWSNCAAYALELCELAGLSVGHFKSLIPQPAVIHGMLSA